MQNFLIKLARFSGVAFVSYILLIGILSNTAKPILFNRKPMTNIPLNRPETGLSVLRYHEADTFGKVDLLFLGSSHCYRTFDTKWYGDQGIRSFNLGSSSQPPSITYFLAKKFLKTLDPELVVLEVYSEILRSDGVESLLDQLSNRRMEWNLLQMTASVGGIKAWNGFLVHLLDFTRESIESRNPGMGPRVGVYVSGGFVQRDLMNISVGSFVGKKTPVNNAQLENLESIIKLVQAQGRKIVLVGQPLPTKTLNAIGDYSEIQVLVQDIGSKYGVPFYDFNGLLDGGPKVDLHDPELFYDNHHLNPAGVAVFNTVFLEVLKHNRYL